MTITTPATIAGNQIREAREHLKLTQEQLAAVFGTTKTTVYRWEAQGAKPAAIDHPGAVWMALEYLKLINELNASALLATVDERIAELETFRDELALQAQRLDSLRQA